MPLLQICPPGGATCISWKLAQLALVTRLHHHIALNWHYQLVLSWTCIVSKVHSKITRVTTVKSQQPLVLTQWERTGPIDQTPGTPGSNKNHLVILIRPYRCVVGQLHLFVVLLLPWLQQGHRRAIYPHWQDSEVCISISISTSQVRGPFSGLPPVLTKPFFYR